MYNWIWSGNPLVDAIPLKAHTEIPKNLTNVLKIGLVDVCRLGVKLPLGSNITDF